MILIGGQTVRWICRVRHWLGVFSRHHTYSSFPIQRPAKDGSIESSNQISRGM